METAKVQWPFSFGDVYAIHIYCVINTRFYHTEKKRIHSQLATEWMKENEKRKQKLNMKRIEWVCECECLMLVPHNMNQTNAVCLTASHTKIRDAERWSQSTVTETKHRLFTIFRCTEIFEAKLYRGIIVNMHKLRITVDINEILVRFRYKFRENWFKWMRWKKIWDHWWKNSTFHYKSTNALFQ